MRHQDNTIRVRAYGLEILAVVGAAGVVYAYTAGHSPIAWWVVLVGALAGSFHYHRRSRK